MRGARRALFWVSLPQAERLVKALWYFARTDTLAAAMLVRPGALVRQGVRAAALKTIRDLEDLHIARVKDRTAARNKPELRARCDALTATMGEALPPDARL